MTTPKKCDKEQERITDAPTHQMGDDARTTIYPLNFILSTALATTILPSLMWISFSDQWVHGHYIQPWYYVIIWWAVDLERGALNHIVLVPSALPVSCRMHGCLQIGARSKHHRSFHCLSSLTLFIHLFETIVNGKRHRLDAYSPPYLAYVNPYAQLSYLNYNRQARDGRYR